ncbi:ABC transporter permease [Neobacillus vireti]|uniref:ABC-2 type transporter family protein n=1 Tax=Neobacillus vireti LMG 21834 TaxID=1131730 RepID=A0AB94IKX2_9BACI|nr:ABC transporter permease [Neobacillus vireti]ETI67694.1 ABC-2 type transporter family protein [Neobacillus vireti LMG 21834]KLT18217.1 ABC transporter [Neobacillus vireti]
MRFLWLAVKDLTLVARDKKAFLTLIMMPLLLIAILGSAFGNMMKEDEVVSIKKFTLGVVNLDQGQLSKVLTEEVFSKNLSKQIAVKYYQEEELYKKIQDHKLEIGIVIDKDFTQSIMSGQGTKIQLITVPDTVIKATIVQNVIEQFSWSVPIEAVVSQMSQPVQAGNQGGIDMEGYGEKPLINETTIDAKTKPVSSFQYYAAAMGVMFLLMTVVQGVSTMVLEKEQEVFNRLLLTNLTYSNYLLGKMLGLITICLTQAFIIILGTSLLFGVGWGASVSGIIVMTLAFVINASGLGVLAGSFMKTEKSFGVAGMFATQIMAALGGSMVPLYVFPDWVVFITKFLPNGLALQTYLDLMSGAVISKILPAIAASVGFGLFFFALGLIRLSMERRGKYA